MTDREIDDVLKRAADIAPVEPPKVTMAAEVRPVRPIRRPAAWIAAFLLVFAVVSIAGAAAVGMYGIRVLTPGERGVIFGLVAAVASVSALAIWREMMPASGQRIAGLAWLASVVGLLAIFALLFRGFTMDRFVPRGLVCLRAGLVFAIPAAFALVLLARRGFVLSLPAIGMAAGTLAGLAGVGVLEIHCPILNAAHVMVWHAGVVAISGGTGWAIGKLLRKRLS